MLTKKKKDPFAKGGHTLFDTALEITGDVRFAGTLDIEGTVKGNVIAESSGDAEVNVRSRGQVIGEIHAPKIVINGHVNGDVYCSKHLELLASAVITGDVHYKVIEMVKGAQVNGKLVYIEEPEAMAPPPETPEMVEMPTDDVTQQKSQ